MMDILHGDVVIVGSGVAGSLCACALAKAGLRVIILEAGPRIDRSQVLQAFEEAAIKDSLSPYPLTAYAPRPDGQKIDGYLMAVGPDRYGCEYLRVVGGTTWHWAACTWRFLPNDFRLRHRYGVGRDWPINYDGLEPYYQRAEQELGVAGSDDEDLGSPRSRPYPLKPIPLSYMDAHVQSVLNRAGYCVVTEPVARNTEVYDGRPACCGSNNCMAICPIGAQYSGDVHALKAEAAGARLIEQAVVDFVEVDADRLVKAVRYRDPSGTPHRVTGRVFIVAANGIETPKLLLISRSEVMPAGVANSSDQVGRNLMDHAATGVSFTMPRPVFPGRGPQEITSLVNLRDGAFRRDYAAKKLHFANTVDTLGITRSLLQRGVLGTELDRQIRHLSVHRCSISSFHEQLPEPTNRVAPSWDKRDALGIPRPQIRYALGGYVRRSIDHTRQTYDHVARLLGATDVEHDQDIGTASHPMGTTIMGENPKISVVDRTGRTHDHRNLFIVGSSVFPSSGSVNPTLTLAALSLVTADTIAAGMQQGGG